MKSKINFKNEGFIHNESHKTFTPILSVNHKAQIFRIKIFALLALMFET